MVYGFSWVSDETLAGMAEPGAMADIAHDLEELKAQGISLLVSLTERPVDPQLLARYDISGLHLPIVDFQPPTLEQLQKFIDHVFFTREQGGATGVHCRAGMGRTGTMLAAFFIAEGMSADQAIEHVRSLRPGSIETQEQEAALEAFEKHLRDSK